MTVVRRLGVASLARIMGTLYFAIGLIVGAIISLLSLAGMMAGAFGDSGLGAWEGPLLGAGAIVFLPLLYGFFGVVGGFIVALLYNLVARWVGGLELELQEKTG